MRSISKKFVFSKLKHVKAQSFHHLENTLTSKEAENFIFMKFIFLYYIFYKILIFISFTTVSIKISN